MNDTRNQEPLECPACNMFSTKFDKFCDAHRLLRGTTVAEITRLSLAQAVAPEQE
jgi:hypothetical protein